ncbi:MULTISPECIES: hypothetical protein [Pectobacterium]|uniref:hypothetical protein n=1 Tax=Pectobacterium TaxID=122277 RepID=UPI0015F67C45|nr:hypothetical protein [Pectobacterium aroidearum]MBA5601037.1 hypothetical protein [Pectobacterium aroidearum]
MTKKVIFISHDDVQHFDVEEDATGLTFGIVNAQGSATIPIESFTYEGATYSIARSCADITDDQVKKALS